MNPDHLRLVTQRDNAMGLYARAVYDAALRWCASQENDGRVPTHMLSVLAALAEIPPEETHNAAQRLVGLGAFEEDTEGPGWVIHDWHEFNPSRVELLLRRCRSTGTPRRRGRGRRPGPAAAPAPRPARRERFKG